MRRFLGRLMGAAMLAVIPALLGLLAAILYTAPGHRLLGRLAGQELTAVLRGRFTLRQVRGSFLHSVEIDSLSVLDTLGQPFADIPRVSVRYALPGLLTGRIVLRDVDVVRPRLRVIKRANGRLNFQEILRLGEGTGNGGPGPLIEFRNLRV
ncbi:MAG TPA: hypothetical protein VNH46_08090, partial [Gemmatimonadales bacterium]|nr:hypothetical protein [Gemmatimonadales bacterium]